MDGTNWSPLTAVTPANVAWYDVTYGGGLFVAVGWSASQTKGQVATSPTGATWTNRVPAVDSVAWSSIAYGDGLFVAVGQTVATSGNTPATNRIMVSKDGVVWYSRPHPISVNEWSSIHYANNLWVATALAPTAGTHKVMTSPALVAVPTPAPTVAVPGTPSTGVAHGIRVPHMSVPENIGVKADVMVHWQASSGLDDATAVSHSLDWIGLYKKGACAQTRDMATTSNGQNDCYLASMTLGAGGATAGSVTFLYTDTRWPAGEYEVRYFLGDSQKGNGVACRNLDNAGATLFTCALEAAATSNSFTVTSGMDDYQSMVSVAGGTAKKLIPGFECGL